MNISREHETPTQRTVFKVFVNDEERATAEQVEVLLRALSIYHERNKRYNDNWQRFGWRGCLFRIRERAERAWDDLWDAPSGVTGQTDDLVDLINFAAFAVRAVEAGNRDGEGAWW